MKHLSQEQGRWSSVGLGINFISIGAGDSMRGSKPASLFGFNSLQGNGHRFVASHQEAVPLVQLCGRQSVATDEGRGFVRASASTLKKRSVSIKYTRSY